jgi:archaellum component FlaD/FlaE
MLLKDLGDDPRKHILAMRWLGYMLQYVDHQGLSKVLDYYQRIGWISKDAKEELRAIAEGLKSTGKGEWTLPFRVHLTSLLFIAKIAEMPIERDIAGIESYVDEWINHPETALSI